MHDPPDDARTGTDRTGDHAVRGYTPLRDFLYDPQDGLDEFFSHSSIFSSPAHDAS